MPFIDLKKFGTWCKKEATPFISATVSATISTGNPYAGLVSGLTTTNEWGGNPLGKVGKQLEPIVNTGIAVSGLNNVVNKLSEAAAKEAGKQVVKQAPKVVLC